MVKITVDISDEDAEIVSKGMNVDVQKLVERAVQNVVAGLKAAVLAKKAGVPLTTEEIQAAGMEMGRDAFEASQKKD